MTSRKDRATGTANMNKNLAKLGHTVFEICEGWERRTHRHSRHSISHPSEGEVITERLGLCIQTAVALLFSLKQSKSKETGYSNSQQASSLQELTCHMGSHSVTCIYPSQLRLVLDLTSSDGCKAEMILLAWLHTYSRTRTCMSTISLAGWRFCFMCMLWPIAHT